MTVSYYNSTQQRYRITLDITTLDDFNPQQIDWRKVLDLQDNESVESVIEDMSNPVSW
jgi:predicted component of type VI protein secretion system